MNKLMLVYLLVNFFFLGCGGLLLAFSLISEQHEKDILTLGNVASNLLLTQCPLTGMYLNDLFITYTHISLAGVVNAIIVFITFLASLPALALPMNKGWLKIQGWLVVLCSFFTLTLGLVIWFDTLQTQKNLGGLWAKQSLEVQSLMQQRVSIIYQYRITMLTRLVQMLWLPQLHVTALCS
jgi:hypothetical protein